MRIPSSLTLVGRHPAAWLALLLVGWVFWPALTGGYLWDDDQQFADVEVLEDPGGWWKVWVTTQTAQYYPLSFTLFWIEKRWWGDATMGYHLVNLLFHACNTWLVASLLRRHDARWGPWLAVVFAIHPLTVQAVAWMCQLRNVSSLFFALWTVHAWHRFEVEGRPRWLVVSTLLFIAALLCKTAVAFLPIVLAISLWTSPAPRPSLASVTPFFVVAFVMGCVTIWYERYTGAVGATWRASTPERLARIGQIALFYIAQSHWPAMVCFVYPRWPIDPMQWSAFVPFGMLVAGLILLAVWDYWQRSGVFLAMLCYLAMLFPVLGWFDVYFMRYAWVSDHWHYPAMPVWCLAWTLLLRRFMPLNWLSQAGALLVIATCAWLARSHAEHFRDNETLWRDTLAKNPRCVLAANNYAAVCFARGDLANAERLWRMAIQTDPSAHEAYLNYARFLIRQNQAGLAEQLLTTAIRLKPDFLECHQLLASLALSKQHFDVALRHAQAGLNIDDHDYHSSVLAAQAQMGLGQHSSAIAVLQDVQSQPTRQRLTTVCLLLGEAYKQDRKFALARQVFAKTSNDPEIANEAWTNIALTHAAEGQPLLALDALRQVNLENADDLQLIRLALLHAFLPSAPTGPELGRRLMRRIALPSVQQAWAQALLDAQAQQWEPALSQIATACTLATPALLPLIQTTQAQLERREPVSVPWHCF